MKTYHGTRLSPTLGDVLVTTRQQWGTCTRCRDLVEAGPDHKFEHFDASFKMCDAPITNKQIIESPLMKRSTNEPSDFEWGPTNLAGANNLSLSILWDVLGERPPRNMVKSFALNTIAVLSRDEWYLNEQDVRTWVYSKDFRYITA